MEAFRHRLVSAQEDGMVKRMNLCMQHYHHEGTHPFRVSAERAEDTNEVRMPFVMFNISDSSDSAWRWRER